MFHVGDAVTVPFGDSRQPGVVLSWDIVGENIFYKVKVAECLTLLYVEWELEQRMMVEQIW